MMNVVAVILMVLAKFLVMVVVLLVPLQLVGLMLIVVFMAEVVVVAIIDGNLGVTLRANNCQAMFFGLIS